MTAKREIAMLTEGGEKEGCGRNAPHLKNFAAILDALSATRKQSTRARRLPCGPPPGFAVRSRPVRSDRSPWIRAGVGAPGSMPHAAVRVPTVRADGLGGCGGGAGAIRSVEIPLAATPFAPQPASPAAKSARLPAWTPSMIVRIAGSRARCSQTPGRECGGGPVALV